MFFRLKPKLLFAVCCFLALQSSQVFARHAGFEAEADSANAIKLKSRIVAGTAAIGYTAAMTGLYNLWYSDYPQSAFHYIDDSREWLQMDKCGHAFTAYTVGRFGYKSLKWAGSSERKATWLGGASGLIFLTSIEVFDGFSAEWGASASDLAANTLGSALFIGQQLAWHEQKIMLKVSYHPTIFANYNPALLGRTAAERLIKDYNGHTHWLSANIASLAGTSGRFPRWLNVAVGYGADGLTGGFKNPSEVNGNAVPAFERYRQFYLAPDIDLSRIRVKSRAAKFVLNALGFVKIPLPAFEFSNRGLKLHPLYF